VIEQKSGIQQTLAISRDN